MEDWYDIFKKTNKFKKKHRKTAYRCLYCNENVYYSNILYDMNSFDYEQERYICNNGCLKSASTSYGTYILNARHEKVFYKALRELKKRNIDFEDIINKDKPLIYYLKRTKNKKVILEILIERKD